MNTAVITGISSGIGRALAQKLLAEDYLVIGTTRSGQADGLDHPNLQVVALEATSETSVQQAVDQIAALTTGTAPDVFAVAPELATFTQTLATNVTGTVFFTEPLLPYLNNGAQVIFVSSNMGLPRNAAPNGPGYRLSKAGINMYATMLAQRVAARHIRVTPMHPGWVQTTLGGSQAPLTSEQAVEELCQGMVTNTESGRFWNAAVGALEAF